MNGWKLTAIILLVIFGGSMLFKGCGRLLAKRQSVPENYTETTKTGGKLEAEYLAMGPHEVSFVEYAAMMSFGKYEICYPSELIPAISGLPGIPRADTAS